MSVSNLNDSGAGSLRDADGTAGARIITFATPGTITQESKLHMTTDNVTIDGSDNAVCLKKYGIRIDAENVVIRNLRVRPGPDSNGNDTDAIQFLDNANRVLVENCSFTWATDENISIVGGSNILVKRCLIAEGLYDSTHPDGQHSMGGLLNSNINPATNNVFYQCIFVKNNSRNPLLQAGDFAFINCIIISRNVFAQMRAELGDTLNADFINCYFDDTGQSTVKHPFDGGSSAGTQNLYLSGNYSTTYGTTQASFLTGNGTLTGSPGLTTDFELYPSSSLRNFLPRRVGARKPYLDACDTRILDEVIANSSNLNALVDDPTDVGGYPVLT